MELKDQYKSALRHIEDYDFVKAIQLCRKCLQTPKSEIQVVNLLLLKFQELLDRQMAIILQKSLSSLFEKPSQFEKNLK